MRLPFFLYIVVLVISCLPFQIATAEKQIKIGVLAYNGKQQAQKRWQPTADYLSRNIPGYQFKIEPLTHEEFKHSINKGQLDFLLTNPGHYVQLEVDFGATRIATFKSRYQDQILRQFSAVIFTRKDKKFQSLKELEGQTFAAVNQQAFGGFQLAQLAFLEEGVDVLQDMKPIWLGFPHRDIVVAVLKGQADVGTVRTGILEKMAANGELDLDKLRILARRKDKDFPLLHSVRLYPEWPFAKLPHTNTQLAKQVTIALLNMDGSSFAARQSEGAGWTIPLDYSSVHEVFRRLEIDPYPPVPLSFKQFWDAYKQWIVAVGLLLLAVILGLFRYIRVNKQLITAQQTLYSHQNQLENTVKQRTAELHLANQALQQDIKSRIKSEKTLEEGCNALQTLYGISTRYDLSREQRLQSIVDMVRQYLGTEYALLSSVEQQIFQSCTCSPGNKALSAPLSKVYADQAMQNNKILSIENDQDWRFYIACPVYYEGKLHCLFEFATSYAAPLEGEQAKVSLSSELSMRILHLVSQWVGNEIMMVETEKQRQLQHQDFIHCCQSLSPREREVLDLLVQGESTKTMARLLNVSTKTIELHRSNLLRKTQAKSSLELVKRAVLSGL